MKHKWLVLPLLLSCWLAACAGGPAGTPPPSPSPAALEPTQLPARPTATAESEAETVRHSVPLDQIIFDTFQVRNRAVPYTAMTPEGIATLRDAIPPIYEPKYEDVAGSHWLRESDLVIGLVAPDGVAYAFPTKILNFHEIVNTTLGGQPLLITYCPLCASAIVFGRQVAGRTPTFGNTSALYESGMVMVDNETDSYWYQVGGEAILGPLTGERLALVPAVTSSWSTWLAAHPDTLVLSRDTGHPLNYEVDAFSGYARRLDQGGFVFPVSDAALDDRLTPATLVLALTIGEESVAFPLVTLGSAATHATIGGQPVVVFSGQFGPTGAAFVPAIDDQALHFRFAGDAWRDEETGSTWSVDGLALSGPLAGRQLARLPAATMFWFAAAASMPQVRVYVP